MPGDAKIQCKYSEFHVTGVKRGELWIHKENPSYIKFLEVHSSYESDARESDYSINLNTKKKTCERILSNAPAGTGKYKHRKLWE